MRWSVIAVLSAVWLRGMLRWMPAPFDDTAAVEIPADVLSMLPGNAGGSPLPPVLTGAYASNALLKKATRLFQGSVVGSESVAVSPSGVLVMLDREGFVFRARASASGATMSCSACSRTRPSSRRRTLACR